MDRQALPHLLDSRVERFERALPALPRQHARQVGVDEQLLISRMPPAPRVPRRVLPRRLRVHEVPPRLVQHCHAHLLVARALVRPLEFRWLRPQGVPQPRQRPVPREQPLFLFTREARQGAVLPIPVLAGDCGRRSRSQPGARVLLAVLGHARVEAVTHLKELSVVRVSLQPPDAAPVRDFEGVDGAKVVDSDALDPLFCGAIAQCCVFAK